MHLPAAALVVALALRDGMARAPGLSLPLDSTVRAVREGLVCTLSKIRTTPIGELAIADLIRERQGDAHPFSVWYRFQKRMGAWCEGKTRMHKFPGARQRPTAVVKEEHADELLRLIAGGEAAWRAWRRAENLKEARP